MKTLNSANDLLLKFEQKFGFFVKDVDQGSDEWLSLKLGVISASMVHSLVPGRGGKFKQARETYMNQLVAQVCTGLMPEINGKALEWGSHHESAARACYHFQTGFDLDQVPFVFKDDLFREGCSPDSLTKDRGVEIKCPYNSENYIAFLVSDKIKPEYQWQVQYSMRVLDCEKYDFAQYDPRMRKKPIKIFEVGRDEEAQKVLEDCIPSFIEEMDQKLKSIGIEFGEQWVQAGNFFGRKVEQ